MHNDSNWQVVTVREQSAFLHIVGEKVKQNTICEAYGVRQPRKTAILQSRFAWATRRVCDGSGSVAKSAAV